MLPLDIADNCGKHSFAEGLASGMKIDLAIHDPTPDSVIGKGSVHLDFWITKVQENGRLLAIDLYTSTD